jgi:hypothetical protein
MPNNNQPPPGFGADSISQELAARARENRKRDLLEALHDPEVRQAILNIVRDDQRKTGPAATARPGRSVMTVQIRKSAEAKRALAAARIEQGRKVLGRSCGRSRSAMRTRF